MRRRIFIFIIFFCVTLILVLNTFQQVWADEDKSGAKPQVISLPSGPGTIEGLGESFEPRLNTGTSAYSVPLAAPKGKNGHQPTVSLVYDGGKGNGPFGIGWDVPLLYIQRQADKGLPIYIDSNDGIDNDLDDKVDESDERDMFIFSNGEEIVPLANGDYRCENEQEFIRFRRDGEGWMGTRRDGTMMTFGTTVEARIQNGTKIFCWYIQKVQDTNGNIILYKYANYPDSPGMVYCKEIRYAIRDSGDFSFHAVVLDYEIRNDRFSDFRSTFQVITGRRCSKIEMITQGVNLPGSEYADHNGDGTMDSLVRRYTLYYKEGADFSLLSKVSQLASDGVNYLPPITFDYTEFELNSGAVVYMENAPPYGFADGDTDLLDANADGLPDLFHTSGSYHFYYENRGNGQWADTLSVMDNYPTSTILLSSPGTHLSDINGDGKSDLVVKVAAQSFRYHLSSGEGGYEDGQPLFFIGQIPTFPFDGNSDVRLIDIDFDKKIDLMLTTSSQYFYWYNLGEGKFSDRISGPVALINPYLPFQFNDGRARLGDMNGDRLQDLVLLQSGSVCYFPNKGYGQWGDRVDMTGSPVVGFRDEFLLLDDINSDGLYDLVLEQTGRSGEIDYWINLGNDSFSERYTISNLPGIISNTTIRIADINGNGTSDIVWSSPFASQSMKYRYLDLNAGIQPNLLASIDNGLGRRIAIEYRSSTDEYIKARESGRPWSQRLPFPISVVSRVTVTTGLDLDAMEGKDAYITEYNYRDGYYDGIEKEFRGFAEVEKTETGDTSAPTKVSRIFFHTGGPDGIDNDADGATDERSSEGSLEDEPLKGKVLKMEIESDTGLLYTRESNEWVIDPLLQGVNGKEIRFAQKTQKKMEVIEGTDSPISLLTTYAYDDFGNVTEEKKFGSLDMDGDEIFSYTEFIHNTDQWIMDKCSVQYVTDGNGQKVSETRRYFDGDAYVGLDLGSVEKGNLTREEGWVEGDTYVNLVRSAFDSFGNVIGIMDGNGNLREIEYDPIFHTFPVTETIHTGENLPLVLTAEYNPGFGVMTQSMSFNGHDTDYEYDSFGRLVKIIEPGDSATFPTQVFSYTLADPEQGLIYAYDSQGNLSLTSGSPTASLVTMKTREKHGQPETFDVYQYSDGLGRKLALVEEAESGFVVKEAVLFNQRGTQYFSFLPYEKNSSEYQAPTFANSKVEARYDTVGREILRINPPNQESVLTHVSTNYFPLHKTVVDENNSEKAFFYDGLERLVRVHEINEGETYVTQYEYDPLDNLTRITDAQNNVKTMIYDGLKRKTEMNDPDQGGKLYVYDNAGNLIQTTDNKGQVISFTYDGANRLLTEDYHDDAAITPDVTFHYDAPSAAYPDAANLKGNLAWVEDLSGATFFSYDARGNPLWTVKRVHDADTFRDYRTTTAYDALDRVVSLTYPDDDKIQYIYNNRTLLESIPGVVNAIDYHTSGQMAAIEYANGIETQYSYDPRQRLRTFRTGAAAQGSETIQDLTYTLDGVGNITEIIDGRSLPLDSPKNANQLFLYDDLHRLTQAKGPGYGIINFQYDRIGNMTFKTSPDAPNPGHVDDALINLGSMAYGGAAGSSDRTGRLSGDPPGPHAVTGTQSGLVYDYDDNGNMVSHAQGDVYSWDFKDRLVRVQTADADSRYGYDYTGQRIVKKVNDGSGEKITHYVSKEYEIREGQPLKYVFAESRRVARIEGMLADPVGPVEQNLSLYPGWNLFSLAVESSDPAISEVLGSIAGKYTELWTFDSTGQQYIGYVPGEEIADLSELHAGRGYLIKMSSPAVLSVSGERVTVSMPLVTGSNLVACPSVVQIPVQEAFASITAKLKSVWSLDANSGKWRHFDAEGPVFLNDLSHVEPGKAYWLQMETGGILELANTEGKIFFYHPDHLGSSNMVTDENGVVVESTEFYPYGRPRYEEQNGFGSDYRYTGKELDEGSGLMYFAARYFEPVIGKFISVDPLYSEIDGFKEDGFETILPNPHKINIYNYAWNNPLSFIDRNGLNSEDVVIEFPLDEMGKNSFGNKIMNVINKFQPIPAINEPYEKNLDPVEELELALSAGLSILLPYEISIASGLIAKGIVTVLSPIVKPIVDDLVEIQFGGKGGPLPNTNPVEVIIEQKKIEDNVFELLSIPNTSDTNKFRLERAKEEYKQQKEILNNVYD